MDRLLSPHKRAIPSPYWVAAALCSFVVLGCYATTYWYPHFARDWISSMSGLYSLTGLAMVLGGLLVGGLATSGIWLALRWPWLGIVLVLMPLVPSLLDGTPVHFGVIAGLCAVAVTASWRRPVASVVAVSMAFLVVTGWLISDRGMEAPFQSAIEHESWTSGRATGTGGLYLVALMFVLAGALGMRLLTLREGERRELAARSGAVEEQAAVVGERARLARDLHDVVAHHVSLIAVRAETAPYTQSDLSPGAREVLTDIAADARLALDELRGVLGILGRSGEQAERAPQPTWRDITALVERTRAAGVDIRLDGDTEAAVPASTGYAVYRIVQEALTNARRHAPGATVNVQLGTTTQLVSVRVATPLAPSSGASAPGHGLVGMRERVETLGGRLLAGPSGTDFVVDATLPRSTGETAA